MNAGPRLSIVVPLYNSEATIGRLIAEIGAVKISGGLELILVNDGSSDGSEEIVLSTLPTINYPVTLISLSRNFGEHNAILAGLRSVAGEYVVTMDDDLQNPPSEIPKLLAAAQSGGYDVVYSAFEIKQHAWWRNAGSWLTNFVADFAIDKPRGLYLSSFRCLSHFVAHEVAKSHNPFPYIDALIFQVTRNVGSVKVRHDSRVSGESGYNARKLIRLWISMLVNASIMPLRIAGFIGALTSGFGFLSLIAVIIEHQVRHTPAGWGSIMAALLVFSGIQLLMLGILGEYVGRSFLHTSDKPQGIIQRKANNAMR